MALLEVETVTFYTVKCDWDGCDTELTDYMDAQQSREEAIKEWKLWGGEIDIYGLATCEFCAMDPARGAKGV